MDRFIGKVFEERYEIQQVIGYGGMAVVYRALDIRLNRYVAVKILKEEFTQDDESKKRFYNESQAIAKLSHPNIVSVFDVNYYGDDCFFVMEYLNGMTLKNYIKQKGKLDIKTMLRITVQILSAMEHAHAHGIIHRDIKPQNIMLLSDGTVKVMDFGIARTAQATRTLRDKAIGTVHYISPEQAKGGSADERSDIYSLGVVMYEMATGQVPFDADTAVSIALMQIQEPPAPPSKLVPEIDPGLEDIILHAMEKDPDDRYSTAVEMKADVYAYIKNPDARFLYVREPAADKAPLFPSSAKSAKASLRAGNGPAAAKKQEQTKKVRKESSNVGSTIAKIVGFLMLFLIIIGIVGVCGYFVWNQIQPLLNPSDDTIYAPNLVGSDYDVMVQQYPDISIVKNDEDYHDTIPAGSIILQRPLANSSMKKAGTIRVTISLGPKPYNVPELSNMSETLARLAITNAGLTPEFKHEYNEEVPKDAIIRVEPEIGTVLKKGDTVTVYYSDGPEPIYVKMPEILDLELGAAQLLTDPLDLILIVEYADSSEPIDTILNVDVEPGTEILQFTEIKVVVSNGSLVDPVDPIDPVDPVDPPVDPIDPVDPVDPPVDPIDPVDDPPKPDNSTVSIVAGNGVHSRELTLSLPQRTASFVVEVFVNNESYHAQTYTSETKTMIITVRGNVSATISVFIDGVMWQTYTYNFI